MNSILQFFASIRFGPAADPEYWTMVQTLRSAFQKAETEIRYGTKVQLYPDAEAAKEKLPSPNWADDPEAWAPPAPC